MRPQTIQLTMSYEEAEILLRISYERIDVLMQFPLNERGSEELVTLQRLKNQLEDLNRKGIG